MAKRWTESDEQYLRENYLRERAAEIGQELGRTRHAVEIKASKMGIADSRAEWRTWPHLRARVLRFVGSPSPRGCWEWKGSVDMAGYGRIKFRDVSFKACKLAWMAFGSREWPEGMHSLHSCDNPICVNPAHIRPGTHSENMKEAWERGGHRRNYLARQAKEMGAAS